MRKLLLIILLCLFSSFVWAQDQAKEEKLHHANDFIINTLVPLESIYFQPGIGIDRKSGMPFDHVRVRLKQGILGEVGNYTAASKLSLSIPYLLGVIQEKPVFQHARITPEQAKILLERALRTHLRYIDEHPAFKGFLAWVDIRPDGTISPANFKIPSLDNGQLTWALAAVVAAFEDSSHSDLNSLAKLAQKILLKQNYRVFYDPEKGLLHGTMQMDPWTAQLSGDKTYYLDDMFEGIMAVLWGILHGQIPEEAWDNIHIPTEEYLSEMGEVLTTFQGFRASFHEHWALGYLPLLESSLAPLYRNYLYVQADFSKRKGLPGFLSTAYDPRGTYRQMGIPEIARLPVDRSDVAVVFATAMAIFIEPEIGTKWLKNLYQFPGVLTPHGAVESVGVDGYADIFTADGKGMTLLAVSGGIVPEIKKYLESRTVPKSGISMYQKFLEMMESKEKQMLEGRGGRSIHKPTKPFPSPAEKQIYVEIEKLMEVGEFFDVSTHLQPGHLHGKNVTSLGLRTLEDDIGRTDELAFEFDIPVTFPFFNQWAFRGTYIDEAVSVAGMKYVSLAIPIDSQANLYDVEFKSDDILLTGVTIDTSESGYLSEDGMWKIFVKELQVLPEAEYKPFNYFTVSVHDPRYMKGKFKEHSRHSTVRIKDIKLFKNRPVVEKTFGVFDPVKPAPGDIEVVQYWKLSHGDLITHKDNNRKVIKFKGDAGWKGGYIPYVNTQDYQFMNLKVRNLRPRTSGFYFELKREEDALFGEKIWVTIPGDSEWHVIQVKIPKDDGQGITRTVNYLALSDPIGDFELSSITFSNEEIAPPETARAAGRSPHGRRRIPAIFTRKPIQETLKSVSD